MYWGIIEWAFYYTSPPYSVDPKSVEAVSFASTYDMFHWGFSAWVIYCVPSIPIAYAVYIKKQKSFRLSTVCRGIIGDHADGLLGKVNDVCFMFGLIGGIGTSLALGTPLLAEGVHHFFDVKKTLTLYLGIINCAYDFLFNLFIFRSEKRFGVAKVKKGEAESWR